MATQVAALPDDALADVFRGLPLRSLAAWSGASARRGATSSTPARFSSRIYTSCRAPCEESS
jgi:hypothetical protein